MTTREKLNRRKRRAGWVVAAGAVVIFAGIAAALLWEGGPVVVLIVPGLVLMVGGAGVAQGLPVPCVACGRNVGAVLLRGARRVAPELRYCPYCAASLDAAPGTADPEPDAAGW